MALLRFLAVFLIAAVAVFQVAVMEGMREDAASGWVAADPVGAQTLVLWSIGLGAVSIALAIFLWLTPR
jgi:hypothetical protein